ncbi:putative bifunctional diguanylate cyclase/phosphodiesterase [Kineosporia mesophila]|nr:bifunctional diguanylate cyclase/phosphodiesterase [Kineosporia mesophila]MCD5349409.1 bifunctional diguanylate cyclase/phosphodiesterase [Kineosporia mesophila]
MLAATAVVAAVLVAEPGLRSVSTGCAGTLSVGLIVLGVVRHRPGSASWPLLALMLAFWALSAVLVHVQGHISSLAVAAVWAGQAVATGVTVNAVVSGKRPVTRSLTAGLDLIIIATVTFLVGAQIVAAGTSESRNWTAVAVASVDVALLSMLVRFAVSRRALGPSNVLVLVASFLAIVYDLLSAVQGRRLALPGEPSQILAVVFMLLFGIAALHPSMARAFSADTFTQRRPPSTALLGLLPLVLVPSGVAWAADVTGSRNLPPWAIPAAGAIIAGLCLLRGSDGLRSSEYLAEHDPLTGLANRRGLDRAFDEAPRAGGLSLLLIDLDEFKQVNDTHGHNVGDALLLLLRDRLVRATGTSGLAARLGGDEFVVLTQPHLAPVVAERFLQSLREPAVVGDLVLRTGASVGTADATSDATLAELLTHADVAMYAAKAAGGGRALAFHPAMRAEVARRFTLSSQVRQLLGHETFDVGRLEIRYQPLVELHSGRVIGAEALVRWMHPEHGLLSPDAFLGLVNSNHLDTELDAVVLNDVLTQLAQWRDQGLPMLPVSVNLTRDSLEDARLADRVLAALAVLSLPTSVLHLEITEHDQLSTDSPAQHTLGVLDAAGVRVYLDDYGTGYTSLEYLHRFPIKVLKLDRSVVTPLDAGQVHLVGAVNAMAVALDLEILAEGIETPEQRDQLMSLGIRYGQGYLFSRPLTAAQYAQTALAVTDESVPFPRPAGESARR